MRIIGLDVGTKTVGVALSDPLGITAQPFETITRKDNNKLRRTYARIEQIISEYDVTEVVVGYPKNMDDTIGERAKACEEFAAALERRTGLPVTLWDERLTTVEADEVLEECGVKRENRKTVIDQIAAVLVTEAKVYVNGALGMGIVKGENEELAMNLAIIDGAYKANIEELEFWRICFSWKGLNLLTIMVRRHNFM